jgi:flagellar biosynthesis protein FlhG
MMTNQGSEHTLPLQTDHPESDDRAVVVEDQAGPLRLLAQTAAVRRRKRRIRQPGYLGKHFSRTIAVTSGKGGVGKTNLACNLAIQLSKSGERALILDADLGLSSIDTILGLLPRKNLYHAIFDGVPISDVITIGPAGVKIITGGSGILELAHLSDKRRNLFIDSLEQLEAAADWFIIDTGAGLGKNVMAFIRAATEVLVVTTPEPTSVTDAYAMVKVTAAKNPAAGIGLVVNMARSRQEADSVSARIAQVSRQFLNVSVAQLGFVPFDEAVSQAVRAQSPVVAAFPGSPAAKAIRGIADTICGRPDEVARPKAGFGSFVERLRKIWQ